VLTLGLLLRKSDLGNFKSQHKKDLQAKASAPYIRLRLIAVAAFLRLSTDITKYV